MQFTDEEKARLIMLFDAALELSPDERAAFVNTSCGDNAALRRELSTLLEANDSAPGYFDALAADIVGPAYASVMTVENSANDPALLSQLESRLGKTYRFERELSGGAMSRVFLAEEIKLGRKVVVKVLPEEMTASVSAERFRREIQVAAQLHHPHIVPLLTSDSNESLLYYTMPYVEGESLRERLARETALSVRDAVSIWRDVLDALGHAHANLVIHRDIKPANILLSGRNALVTDFGIARAIEAAADSAMLTGTGLVIGTPAYMAPEQVVGSADSDHRVDIYAAALVMYEMLEGHPPFSGNSVRELVLMRLSRDPLQLKNPNCPRGLAELVLSCLATDPAKRPQSAESILTVLDGLALNGDMTDSSGFARLLPGAAVWRRKILAVLIGFAVAILAFFAAGKLRNGNGAILATDTISRPSIAVLPLTNLSTLPGDAALADGMTEELIATLGKTGNLRVIASTSVFAFKGQRLGVRQIADSLRVSHILEGGFQKVGDRVRMQVRLIDARDGTTAWSETYDRKMGDILAVQDDISDSVARELDIRLAGGGRPVATRRRYTPDAAAYEWYLRGMNGALMASDSGRRQALEYFDRAISADSNFAAAYAGLVRIYLQYGANTSQPEWQALAEKAALKAVALDDSLAEAHAALGWARVAGSEYSAAETELKRAIALDPNVPRGHEGLARLYMLTQRPAEQLAAARIGLENDPFSHAAIREFALALSVNGRCDEAITRLLPLKKIKPPAAVAGVILGACYVQKQNWALAIAEFRWAMSHNAAAALPMLGFTLARAGQEKEARKILSDLLAGRSHSNGAYGVAVLYAGLHDHDQAFAWLDKAAQENSVRVYIMDPMFHELHGDPRFARFRKRLGH